MVISLDGKWQIAVDPKNVGRDEQWWRKPAVDAKETKVPWIIQDAFPSYHGVAWYWKSFTAPANPHPGGRNLLRFWAVDYLADVWVNGVHIGDHEGAEIPFVLDATDAIKPGAENHIAVRVLNPSYEPIDGYVLKEIPHRHKKIPYQAGNAANHGGITDSVELVLAPAIRIEDLFVRPDWKTGIIRISASIVNASTEPVKVSLSFTVAPAASGETLNTVQVERELSTGETLVETEITVDEHRLWELNDPYLYRVTAKITNTQDALSDTHEYSTRCGFRDFRFENGYFRLNGKRTYLKGSHTCNHFPVGLQVPGDPDFARRDLIYAKMAGFNCIRFIAGMPTRYQLDLCDELGLMVYEENYASWFLEDSPKLAERYDRIFTGMVKRDRNHPSIVIWGMLNEEGDVPVFRHAVVSIPLMRALDDTRMLILDSGRFDRQITIGSICNPGSSEWDGLLGNQGPDGPPAEQTKISGYVIGAGDVHCYTGVPQDDSTMHLLRTMGEGEKHNIALMEYGIGSAVNWPRVYRQYEQMGKTEVEDARFYKNIRDVFMRDWELYGMDDTWADPDEYFDQCIAKMAGQRRESLNLIRSNPHIIGHSMTGTIDQGMTGEGLWTIFRELKPGTMDALSESWAPLKWCLFAQPENVYSGAKVKFEAVLANEDALMPGDYPVRLQVVGPDGVRVMDKIVTVKITDPKRDPEPSFVLSVFSEDVLIEGPAGKYRFLATFQKGASSTCGEIEFYVSDPADMPAVNTEVVIWGDDPELADWLSSHGISNKPFTSGAMKQRELILVGKKPAAGGAAAWEEIVSRIKQGAAVVFLCPEVFAEGDNRTHWLPLQDKGGISEGGDLYIRDEWAKDHPIFDGLPTGLLDYTFYRDLLADSTWAFTSQTPTEVAAGAVRASIHPSGYASGFLIAVCRAGAGMFVLNTLHIRSTLGKSPVAERLLRNMLRCASMSTVSEFEGKFHEAELALATVGGDG